MGFYMAEIIQETLDEISKIDNELEVLIYGLKMDLLDAKKSTSLDLIYKKLLRRNELINDSYVQQQMTNKDLIKQLKSTQDYLKLIKSLQQAYQNKILSFHNKYDRNLAYKNTSNG